MIQSAIRARRVVVEFKITRIVRFAALSFADRAVLIQQMLVHPRPRPFLPHNRLDRARKTSSRDAFNGRPPEVRERNFQRVIDKSRHPINGHYTLNLPPPLHAFAARQRGASDARDRPALPQRKSL